MVPLPPVEGDPGPPPQPQAEGGGAGHHCPALRHAPAHPHHRTLRDREDVHRGEGHRDVASGILLSWFNAVVDVYRGLDDIRKEKHQILNGQMKLLQVILDFKSSIKICKENIC